MPNRILREGILTSPRMAKLGWPEEVFFRRLMSVVDDFGRYYADLGLLHAACYPRQLNKVSDSDIGKWLACCEAAALVRVYPAPDGERYVQLLDFGQQVRAKKSRYPDPLSGCVADAAQAHCEGQASAHLGVSVSVGVSEVVVEGDSPRKREPAPDVMRPDDVSERVWKDWRQLRKGKKASVSETVLAEARKQADLAGLTLERFLTIWCLRGSQGLDASWLKPEERGARGGPSEPAWRAEQRERTQQAAPGVAARGPNNVIELEANDVTPRRLG